MSSVDDALAWIEQARSDARTADLVTKGSPGALPGDIGCHVALLCAQSFEKCIKGCMLLVGQTLTLTHSVETSIDTMLVQADGRRQRDPRRHLRQVFAKAAVRRTVRDLLSWMPGNARDDEPNYEYPWRTDAGADLERPCTHAPFEDEEKPSKWARIARDLSEEAAKVAEAVRRG